MILLSYSSIFTSPPLGRTILNVIVVIFNDRAASGPKERIVVSKNVLVYDARNYISASEEPAKLKLRLRPTRRTERRP